MTRESRREIERTVEDLEPNADDDPALPPPIRSVYRDPVTHRLYEGRGDDADPVETVPEDGTLIVGTRALVMDRDQAKREGREIIGPVDDAPDGVVRVRIRPAPTVPVERAAVLNDWEPDMVFDFAGAST